LGLHCQSEIAELHGGSLEAQDLPASSPNPLNFADIGEASPIFSTGKRLRD
jgi:hypothetical protein